MSEFSKPKGMNFSCADNVSAEELATALCKTPGFLQAVAPYVSLLRYDDWWEHDGLHFGRGGIDFDVLFRMVRSPQSLLEAMPGDDDWYLRFYLFWDDDGYKLLGRFDLTLPPGLRAGYQEEVVQKLNFEMKETESAVYYESLIP